MSKDCSLLFVVVVVIHKSGRPHKRFLLLFNWKSERGFSLNAKLALNVVSNRSIYWRQDFAIQCIDLLTVSRPCLRAPQAVVLYRSKLVSFIQSRSRFSNNLLYVSSLSVDSTHMRRVPLLLHVFFFHLLSLIHTCGTQPCPLWCQKWHLTDSSPRLMIKSPAKCWLWQLLFSRMLKTVFSTSRRFFCVSCSSTGFKDEKWRSSMSSKNIHLQPVVCMGFKFMFQLGFFLCLCRKLEAGPALQSL